MAVQANKRKRKHKAIEDNVDEADSAVPKKVLKENETPPVDDENGAEGQEYMDNEEQSVDLENEETTFVKPRKSGDSKQEKFSKDFKMMNFRNKLRNGNFITELRHFLYLADIKPKMISKFLEKRGKPLELVEALDRIDKSNVFHVFYVCKVLQMLIMEILTNQKDHLESAIQASRYFLKSYASVLDDLLKSLEFEHRRIALKLMTAFVCVEPQLGKQILNSYDLLSNTKSIDSYLSHTKHEANEEETIRKCYIHFVLAFLVDGNSLLVRNIIDKGLLIKGLISGLLYDDDVTVCVVLSTLKKSVLESSVISKTKKIHVFDLDCCKHLVALYDWRGPKVFAAMKTLKSEATSNKYDELKDPKSFENVTKVVHEFLVTLLTSRKQGVAFDAISSFRQKHNVIQGKLLGWLHQPWKNPLKVDLVLKVVQACPELARYTMRNYNRLISSLHFHQNQQRIEYLNFIRQFIDILKPQVYQASLQHMTLTDVSYWIKDTLLPMDILLVLRDIKNARDDDYYYRLSVAKLLRSMFTQYSNYMKAMTKREQSKSDNSMRRFKFDLLSHLLLYFPTIENILLALRFTVKGSNLDITEIHEHLDVVFDILLVVFKENRSVIDKTNSVLDFLILLRPLYTDDNTVPNAKHHNISLELKAIKTMLLLFPHVLEPQEKLFASVVTSFIKAFVHGTDQIQRDAGILLRGIFKNTGIFDSSDLEIDLWLEALRLFDINTVEVVTKVFIEVLQVTKASVDTPNTAENVINKESLYKLFDNIEKDLSVQAYLETISISKLVLLIFKGIEIVEPFKEYLEMVLLLMFHYYPTPEFVKNVYDMELSSLKPYMSSWLSRTTSPKKLKSSVTTYLPQLAQIQDAIMDGDKTFQEIFNSKDAEKSFAFEMDGITQNFGILLKNERLVMIYIQEVFFMVAQLTEKQLLEKDQAERAANFLNILLSLIKSNEDSQSDADQDEESDKFLPKVLNYIFVIRLSYIRSVELLSATDETHLNYLHFLRLLIDNCKTYDNIDIYTENYRLKLVKSVAICLQDVEKTKGFSDQLEEGVKLFESFNLSLDNCVDILNLLTGTLCYNDLFVSVDDCYKPSIFYNLLCCVMRRLGTLKQCVNCNEALKKLSKMYINMHKKLSRDLNLEEFEDSLFSFLNVSHQSIHLLSNKFFDCFFMERKLSKFSIKLACLLLERNDKLQVSFVNNLPSNLTKKEIIYPLLNTMFRKSFELDNSLMQSIYQEYKNGFMKTIEKPQKAGVIYKENVECSIALIEKCMPKSECADFTNKSFKFDVIEPYQIRIIQAIYKKAYNSLDADAIKQKSLVVVNFVNLMIQMCSVDLKKQNFDEKKFELLSFYLYSWLNMPLPSGEDLIDFNKVLKNPQWMNFCKSCLKLGMHINESEADVQENDKENGFLLKLLAFVCDKLYLDYSTDNQAAHQEPVHLFEMICTHSKFFDIILSHNQTQVKTQVLHLLFTLAKKAPSVLTEEQIPVILGAYQARLSDSDRYALGLLQLFELYDCGLQNYRPFIWGESAIAFYALRSGDEERAKLSRQETSIAQVMSLIDNQICEYTLENFPVWRKLDSLLQMPKIEFLDPEKKSLVFGSNDLERLVELGCTEFSEADRRFCPKREGLYEQCYDPAFFIPLMSMCFAPESYVHPARPVQNGLLALSFAGLSSQDKDMRLAAACVQLRYRAHFEQNKFFEKPLWIQAYDNIQAGLSNLRDSWMKHRKNSGTPRVPYIPCLFIAKTFNICSDPTHLLYKQLTMYLRLKSSFNFETIPEFNILFYSPEVEHIAFRKFIIEIITSGVKTSSDLFLLFSTNTFKVLMGFYGSTMSSLEMNLLILSLFSTCVKIPGSSKIMLDNVGIIPWLSSIISSLEFHQFDVIEGLITIISNFWYALKANAQQFHNFAHISLQMHRLLLQLAPHLSARISVNSFAKFVNILNKTSTKNQFAAMSSTQLDHLIHCATKHFPDQSHVLSSFKKFGGNGALENDLFCKQLFQDGLEQVAILALSSFRTYVIEWWLCMNDSIENVSDVSLLV